MKVEA
jgi:hypothetical protein